jgi:hypothetical protein
MDLSRGLGDVYKRQANNHNPSKIMKILGKDYDNQELLVELRQISIKILNSELG